MQTRSRTVEIPSGLSLPLAFGMNTRLIGSGRYVSSLSASASSASHRSTPYASMSAKSWPSTPGAPPASATVGILPQLPAGYVAFERCEYRFGRFQKSQGLQQYSSTHRVQLI